MPRSALACGVADGMCHVDQRAGRLHIPLRVYRCVSVVARTFFLESVFSLVGIGLLSFVPYLAWVYVAYRQGGQPFLDLVLEENTGRFMGKMSYESHENPIWYNFLTLIWGWIPWTLVLVISLFGLKWKNMRCLPEGDPAVAVEEGLDCFPQPVSGTIVHVAGHSDNLCLLLHPQE